MTAPAVVAGISAKHPLVSCRWHVVALAATAAALYLAVAPCPAQALPPLSSQVRIDEQVVHYPLTGSSIEELQAQLQRRAASTGGAHGRTHSEITVEYQLDQATTGCRMRDLEVRLAFTVMLPEWTPAPDAPPELVERWNLAAAALERHEATHRAHARTAADVLRRRLLAIGAQPDCTALRYAANRQLLRAKLWQQFKDWRYDVRTRNGATEGAVL